MVINTSIAYENLFYIETWGCQMNEEDSEKICGILESSGYTKTDKKEEAGIIIFNTCCVRENAELKVYGNLGILKKYKEKNPNIIIVVCGCMMQQKGMADNIVKKYPFVDIVIGTFNAHKIMDYINAVKEKRNSVVEIWDKDKGIIENIPIERKSNIKAFVTITYGCNNFCTYCVVPYVRGRERSRSPQNIKNEIICLVKSGFKEVTLLGQNVNSYGKDLVPAVSFADLLSQINDIEGLERIRFMTPHPKDLSDDVIEAVANLDKVCEHIHLPVQSGSSRILKLMNRHYTREQYLECVKKIRKRIPEASITTDIIVGFPGETEKDFEDTLSLVNEVEYDSVFTFIYSKRSGTPAEKMKDQIDEAVKHERFNRLTDAVNKICAKKNKEYEGKTVEVLVEDVSKNNKDKLMGRTRKGTPVNFTGDLESMGKLVNVRITKAHSFSLNGEMV